MSTQLIDDLEIGDRVLDLGEFGALYRARLRSTDRPVALHLLEGSTEELRTANREQMDLLCQLKDRHVLEVLGTGTWEGRTFCLTEWSEGEDLDAQLRKGYKFTTEEILHIAEGVARALHAASRLGLVHGHLCPANVLLLPDGTVKVARFGMATIPDAMGGEMTPPPTRLVYLAPEQTSAGIPDSRSDIYSLGALLFELSSGRPPFEGYDSTTSLLYQIVHVGPLPPRQLGSSIPRQLERLILRCLDKNPDERPSGPVAFLEQLRQVQESLSSKNNKPVAADEDTGDFEIHEDQVIGEGGMGTLIRGRQRSLDRAVAIKVLREDFSGKPEFVQRFRREAELLAQVDCPNVVQIYGTGVWHGRFFYAMELVKGEDLCQRYQRGQRFAPAGLLDLAEGVGNALRAAWKYKIVHRDIKPSNILLTPDGVVKVADFGLAKSLRIPGDSKVIAGTAEYLSPEQGLGQRIDVRSDLYSLGVVLYELAADRHPFHGVGSSVALIFQHVHTEPPPLAQIAGQIPPAIQSIIHRCLQKKPEERFQTPDELLAAVRAARTNPHATGAATPRSSRGRKPIFIAALSIALACSVGGFLFFRPGASPLAQSADRMAYEVAMGLGQYAQAIELAERTFGADSSQAREARRRFTEQTFADARLRALERLKAHDWAGALAQLEELRRAAPELRRSEVDALIDYCRVLESARVHETKSEWEQALAIYQGLMRTSPAQSDYLRERIDAVQARLRK